MASYDFASIGYNERDSAMFNNMARAITAAEAWDWIRNFSGESFMFSGDPMIQRITEKMGDGANQHSGASFGLCMRTMEYIAKHGWDGFVAEVAKNRKAGGRAAKYYKDKKTGEYLGRLVKTEDEYPDGPGRGGVTRHTFEKDGKMYVVIGSYNDMSGFELV
jgi:hypothetical protein